MKNEVLIPEINFIVRPLPILEHLTQDTYEAKKQRLTDADRSEG